MMAFNGKNMSFAFAALVALSVIGASTASADFQRDVIRRSATPALNQQVNLPGIQRVEEGSSLDLTREFSGSEIEQIETALMTVYGKSDPIRQKLPEFVEKFWNAEKAPANLFFYMGVSGGAILGTHANVAIVFGHDRATGRVAYLPAAILRIQMGAFGGDVHFGLGYLKESSPWFDLGASVGAAWVVGVGAGTGAKLDDGQFRGSNAIWAEVKFGASAEFGPYIEFFPVLK